MHSNNVIIALEFINKVVLIYNDNDNKKIEKWKTHIDNTGNIMGRGWGNGVEYKV